MALEANPIIQTTQTSLHTNPTVATQAALQGMPDFQKQQRLLSQNSTAATQTGQSAQATQTGQAAQAFISHGQSAQIRQENRRDVQQRPQQAEEVANKKSGQSAGNIQVNITQQDLEHSFVNLLRDNLSNLRGNQQDDSSKLTSNDYTMNFLHNNYQTRVMDSFNEYGSMVLLEKKGGHFQDTLGMFANSIYNTPNIQLPITYFAN